jgi:hypothetical protein
MNAAHVMNRVMLTNPSSAGQHLPSSHITGKVESMISSSMNDDVIVVMLDEIIRSSTDHRFKGPACPPRKEGRPGVGGSERLAIPAPEEWMGGTADRRQLSSGALLNLRQRASLCEHWLSRRQTAVEGCGSVHAMRRQTPQCVSIRLIG